MVRRGATDRGERMGGGAAWLPPGPAGRVPPARPGSGPGPEARLWGGAVPRVPAERCGAAVRIRPRVGRRGMSSDSALALRVGS